MEDKDKTKEQLLEELAELRRRFDKTKKSLGDIKQCERKLEYNQEEYRNIFELSPVGIAIVDMKGVVTACNPAIFRIGGYSQEDLIGKHFSKMPLIKARDLPKFIKIFNSLLKGKTPEAFEFSYNRKDGTTGWSEIYIGLLKEGGKLKGIQVLQRDTTEERIAEDSLKKSETKYRELFETIKSGVAVFQAVDGGKDFVIMEMNREGEKIDKVSRKDVIGKRVTEAFPGIKKFGLFAVLQRVWKNGKTEFFPTSLYENGRSAGGWRENWVYRLPGNEIVAVYNDVSSQKETYDEIQRKSEDLALVNLLNDTANRGGSLQEIINLLSKETGKLFSSNGATVYLLSEDKGSLDVQNINLPASVKKSIEKIIGVSITQIKVHLKEGGFYTSILKTRKPQIINDIDAINKMAGEFTDNKNIEKLVPAIIRLTGIRSVMIAPLVAGNRTIGLIDISRDNPFTESDLQRLTTIAGQITGVIRRKATEDTLRKRDEMLQLMFKSVNEGIIVLNLEGVVINANDKLLKLHGFTSRDEIIGKNGFDFIAPEDRGKMNDASRQLFSSGVSENIEITFLRKDGSIFSGEVGIGLLKDPLGKPSGFIDIMRDITERKQLEQERQKIDKLESIGTLAGGIAHDFNNILTTIMGNISLAQRYAEPGSQTIDRLNEAEKASLRAKELTSRLLTFARGGEPIKKVFSLSDLIKESATFALRGSNVKCNFSIAPDMWPVEADEGQINQVITNLVINAAEAMAGGGTIDVSAGNLSITEKGSLALSAGDYVNIIIRDYGTGIPDEYLERIFEPYFSTKQRGSGLGLATSYSIVKNHNGIIDVESRLGAGTAFCIYLPASKQAIPAKKAAPAEAAISGKGRVLVMDDEEVIRYLLNKMLTAAGFEVALTGDGAEAIKQYKEGMKSGQPFDAVIMDLTVPGGMGGYEAIKELLKIDPKVRAVVSSGYSTDPIMANFRQYGFSGVVAKPYKVAEIEKAIRDAISESGE